MTYTLIERLLRDQHECVAVWQLRSAGWSRSAVRERLLALGLSRVPGVDGVWTSVRGTLSHHQRWAAAALTAPDTYVHDRSASLLWRFGDQRPAERQFTVVRHGHGGPRRYGRVVVRRSRVLPEESLTRHHGIPVTTAARTLVDVAGGLDDKALRRAVLEALRLRVASIQSVGEEIARRPTVKGAARLRELLVAVEGLPLGRCRSNAEATALLRRRQAGRPDVAVNEKVGRFEADLIDHERKEITEVDGGAFHVDPELDEERNVEWAGMGYHVTRRPSDDAYDPGAQW